MQKIKKWIEKNRIFLIVIVIFLILFIAISQFVPEVIQKYQEYSNGGLNSDLDTLQNMQ